MNKAAGFTLVEVLIALTLATVVTVLLFAGLRLGTRTWERLTSVQERLEALRSAHNVIERALRQTRDLGATWDGRPVVVFAGEAQRLDWVAPLTIIGMPGLYVLRVALEPTAHGAQLVLTRWLYHPEVLAGTDVSPPWIPLAEAGALETAAAAGGQEPASGVFGRTVLLAEVGDFALAYFGTLPGENEPRWHDTWLGFNQLPRSIRLQLTTPEQSWPAALVTLPGPGELAPWR